MAKKREWLTRDVRIVEATAWGICIASLVAVVAGAQNATGLVPVHWGFDGQPDRWGSPMELVALPAIMLVTIAIMSLILHLVDPKYWNRPGTLQPGEESAWYLSSARLLVWVELECALFCLVMQKGLLSGGLWIAGFSTVVFMVAIIATCIILTARFYRRRSEPSSKE